MSPQEPTAAPAAPAPALPQTHEAARARVEEIRTAALKDSRHPLVNASHPNHDATMAEYLSLHGFIAGHPGPADMSGIEDTGPRLSADPDEAELGLRAPDFAAPDAIESYLDLIGRPLAPELVPLARSIAPQVPAQMTSDVALALSELPTLMAEVAQMSAPPRLEETEALLESEWGDNYERNLSVASSAWDQLPREVQQWIDRAGIRYHPQFLRVMFVLGERFLDTDEGLRSRLAQAAREVEARGQKVGF